MIPGFRLTAAELAVDTSDAAISSKHKTSSINCLSQLSKPTVPVKCLSQLPKPAVLLTSPTQTSKPLVLISSPSHLSESAAQGTCPSQPSETTTLACRLTLLPESAGQADYLNQQVQARLSLLPCLNHWQLSEVSVRASSLTQSPKPVIQVHSLSPWSESAV
jgi:hypothetical protein